MYSRIYVFCISNFISDNLNPEYQIRELALLDNKRAVEILMTAINAPEDRKKKFLVSYKSRIGQKIKSMQKYQELQHHHHYF